MKTRFILIQLLAICLMGCAAMTIPGASPDLLGFLVKGRTTRSQVLTTLGQPAARFEGDRILTYRIGQVWRATCVRAHLGSRDGA